MKWLRVSEAVLVAGAIAIIVSACGGASPDPVQKAAAATDQQSAKMQMTLNTSTATATVSANGSGAVSQGEGELAMMVHASGKTIPLTEIYTTTGGDAILYLRSPAFATQLPAGKTWAKINLTKAEKAQGFNPNTLQPGSQNPSDTLQMLKDATSVQKIGTQQIDGVQTTHYHATVDLAKLASSDPQAARGLRQFESQTSTKTLPVDVRIDGDNHVRRMHLQITARGSGAGSLHMSVTINLSSFGSPVSITPPPASKTANLTAQASKQTMA